MFIHPLDKESASPELSDLFSALTKKFGKIPGIFGTMAHRPGALKGMVEINSAVMEHGTIEPRYRELAYLKTSLNNGCEYWTRAHTASAKRIGITDEQIHALMFYERSPLFDAKEKMTLLFADQVTRAAAAVRENLLSEMRAHYSEDQIVELTLVVCLANFTNRFNDALMIRPDLGEASG